MNAALMQVPDALSNRVTRLLEYFEEVALTGDVRDIAIQVVNDIIEQHHAIAADRARFDGIAQEIIERPIFVTGLPRSGTTLLHAVIGADPNNRVPRRWEAARPSPPPGLGERIEERRALMDREIADIVARDPTLMRSHPYYDQGGEVSADCEMLGILDFHFVRRTMGYYSRIPAYLNVDLIDSDVAFFETHRQILQALQWKAPRKRWALKGTQHFVRLAALKAIYPDAHVIWIHRDPQRSFPSLMTLTSNLAAGMSDGPIDRVAIGRGVLDEYGRLLDAAVSDPYARHPDVYHLRYADFAGDPVQAVRTCYEAFDIPFDDVVENAMKSWLTAPVNRGDRHGKFTYSLDEFGLTPDDLEDRVASYRAAFDIPHENGSARARASR